MRQIRLHVANIFLSMPQIWISNFIFHPKSLIVMNCLVLSWSMAYVSSTILSYGLLLNQEPQSRIAKKNPWKIVYFLKNVENVENVHILYISKKFLKSNANAYTAYALLYSVLKEWRTRKSTIKWNYEKKKKNQTNLLVHYSLFFSTKCQKINSVRSTEQKKTSEIWLRRYDRS